MKYKILLFIFLCCGFRAFSSLADDYIQEVKAKREQNAISFDVYVRNIKHCIHISNTVSTAFAEARDQYKMRVARVQQFCNDPMMWENGHYGDCLGARLKLKIEPEHLIHVLSKIKAICPRLNLKETIQELKNFITTLEESIFSLRKQYREFLMNQLLLKQAEKRKKYTVMSMPFQCQMSILSDFKRLVFRDGNTMFCSEFGDSYGFEKGLKVMNMLKDKISTKVKICKTGDLSDKVTRSEQKIQKMKAEYGKPFDEFAQKACSLLDKSPQNNTLCETPLNNNSWKYSVSQALQKQLGYKVR